MRASGVLTSQLEEKKLKERKVRRWASIKSAAAVSFRLPSFYTSCPRLISDDLRPCYQMVTSRSILRYFRCWSYFDRLKVNACAPLSPLICLSHIGRTIQHLPAVSAPRWVVLSNFFLVVDAISILPVEVIHRCPDALFVVQDLSECSSSYPSRQFIVCAAIHAAGLLSTPPPSSSLHTQWETSADRFDRHCHSPGV